MSESSISAIEAIDRKMASLPPDRYYLLGEVQISLHGPDLRELRHPGYARVETVLELADDGKTFVNIEELLWDHNVGAPVTVCYFALWVGSQLKHFAPVENPTVLCRNIGVRIPPGRFRIKN